MPTKTFFKLTDEKRESIIKSGTGLFAEKSYNEVKISEIIRTSGIPRSSFYDYFEDKKDFYFMLLDMVQKEKKEYFQANLTSKDIDAFSYIKKAVMTGISFMYEKPNYEKMAKRIYENPELIKEKYGESALDQSKFYEYIIKKGIDDNVIRHDIDIEFIAGILDTLISEALIKMLKDGSSDYLITSEKYCDQLIDFLKTGIGKN